MKTKELPTEVDNILSIDILWIVVDDDDNDLKITNVKPLHPRERLRQKIKLKRHVMMTTN